MTEFHRILQKQIQSPFQNASKPHSQRVSELEPLHFAHLMATMNPSSFQGKGPTSYPLSKSTAKVRDVSESLPLRPSPPLHLPTKSQESWLWFWTRGAALSATFTESDLQKQFRKLARLLHPDQNPHPKATEFFLKLREHYERLQTHAHTSFK